MDAYEATRIVFSRIQTLDPENAAKIMGLLLIQDHGEKEMIRLAFGPETLLHSLISKAKKELNLPPSSPSSASSPSSVPASNNPFLRQNSSSRLAVAPPPPLSISSPTWAPQTDFFQDELIGPDFADSPLYGSGPQLRRSYSDLEPSGYGWKPCLYYARGFCKNGSACRFQHGLMPDAEVDRMSGIEQELLLLRSRSQRLGFPYSPLSPSSSSYMFQQNERAATAAAAAAMMLGGDDGYKYMGRPRMDPWSRQIYLTFPADSTFREEDVSNYFSIYGPVQDVRIPYQQKRMFGFVTFLYPETVKLILAKGNPHFVCDARVLVKPYKEKGKIPEKKIQGERGEFSAGNTPTGFDTRDPFEFQQLGPRMMQNYNSNQEMLLRRKMEEQIQAAELQQAIEMQGRRFMGLQLLDFKNRSLSPSTTISSRTTAASNDISYDSSPTEDKSPSPVLSSAMNPGNADKEESGARDVAMPNEDSNFQESGEHNLPDSPFASPTKGSSPFANDPFAVESALEFEPEFDINQNGNHHIVSSSLLSPSSTLDMPSFRSCFLQMPRLSSGHGAVGL